MLPHLPGIWRAPVPWGVTLCSLRSGVDSIAQQQLLENSHSRWVRTRRSTLRPVSSSSPFSTGRAALTASSAAPEVLLHTSHGASVSIAVAFTDALLLDSGVFYSNGVREGQPICKPIEKEGIPGGGGDKNWVVRHRQIHDPGIQQEPEEKGGMGFLQ